LGKEAVKSYLTENIHYSLDPDCLDGMQLFYQLAHECGALPSAPPLCFLDVTKAVVI
jgi:chorismate dehydratase